MIHETQDTAENKITNPGFKEIGEKFLEKGWVVNVNQPNRLEFHSPTNGCDTFEFEVDQKTIHVSVPLKQSRYKYTTKFSDYYLACEFAEMHLAEF